MSSVISADSSREKCSTNCRISLRGCSNSYSKDRFYTKVCKVSSSMTASGIRSIWMSRCKHTDHMRNICGEGMGSNMRHCSKHCMSSEGSRMMSKGRFCMRSCKVTCKVTCKATCKGYNSMRTGGNGCKRKRRCMHICHSTHTCG